ncbi:MAG: cytochrome b, partial [Polaromonas sp.]
MNTSIVQTTSKYGAAAQFFHWATAIAVLAAYTFGPGGSEQHVYAASSDLSRQLHETLGLLVFVLVIMRIFWRIVDKRPDPAPLSPWMEIASRAVQSALYFLLFAVPLTAIAGAWFEGHPLTFLAGLQIPPPVGISHDVGALIANIHT